MKADYNPSLIAIITLALIWCAIGLGYWLKYERPVVTKTKTETIITIPKKVIYGTDEIVNDTELKSLTIRKEKNEQII